MSVVEEFGGGERVKSLFLLSKNRLLTRGLPMDHGSGVHGSVRGKPEEEEKKEKEEEERRPVIYLNYTNEIHKHKGRESLL